MINKIKQRLLQPLPGGKIQLKMAPHLRKVYDIAPKNATIACVLILLFPKNEEWHFVLIQRMPHEKDRHSGQVSFPGGRLEESDISLEYGALREAEEEVGVDKNEIEILGRLTELYIPVSNFLVHPFVGFMEKTPEWTAQPSEVESILEIPLADLLDKEKRKKVDMKMRNNIILKDTPYFDFDGKVVWGATAMMLNELAWVVGE